MRKPTHERDRQAVGCSGVAFLAIFLGMPAGPAVAGPQEGQPAASAGAAALVPQAPVPPSFNSRGRRDPFKSPFDKRKEEPKPEFDQPPARNRRPPGPAGLLVGDAQLMGVVQGPTGRMAMIGGDGPITYFLKDGDQLYDGFIREITDTSIKFVRQIKISSRVVDQQEVVKKISPAP